MRVGEVDECRDEVEYVGAAMMSVDDVRSSVDPGGPSRPEVIADDTMMWAAR